MQLIIVLMLLTYIITLYFLRNPMKHSKAFMWRRFLSWFPLGMTYAFMYMARYNLDALATAEIITKAEKSQISGWGFFVYAASLFISGPLIDRIGGKKGMIMASLGAAVFNIIMGWALFLHLHGSTGFNLVMVLTLFYSLNMFFQSFGAISTIKVKSYWFHVRERGTFGAIFGTLISLGVYFAFDWTEAISAAVRVGEGAKTSAFRDFMQNMFALQGATIPAIWLIFFIPAGFLLIWALIDLILIKDSPDEAGFPKLETHDASHGDHHTGVRSWKSVIKSILTNRIILMIGVIEFTSGVLRDGVMKWYRLFVKDTGLGIENIQHNWGLWAAVTGIVGSFLAGWASDRFFQSRRAPVAGICQILMFLATACMMFAIFTEQNNAMVMGVSALVIMMAVIGVHSIMSGTATADFGGRRGAATATGVADGFSKLGSSFQEFVLGAIITKDTWHYWPSFLMPFTLLGLFFAYKLWQELPPATRKYLQEVELAKVKKK
ncbi:MAG: MFS transporter [Bdellovibrionaceae bacterium]|nr:MFS transporter [Bdellovibrio sp.]